MERETICRDASELRGEERERERVRGREIQQLDQSPFPQQCEEDALQDVGKKPGLQTAQEEACCGTIAINTYADTY